jgi:hypothetical protein
MPRAKAGTGVAVEHWTVRLPIMTAARTGRLPLCVGSDNNLGRPDEDRSNETRLNGQLGAGLMSGGSVRWSISTAQAVGIRMGAALASAGNARTLPTMLSDAGVPDRRKTMRGS